MKSKYDSNFFNENVCVVDGEKVKEGYKVDENDFVINLLRKLKGRFTKLRNNHLYVCSSHYDFYIKKRKSYERIVLIVSTLVVALFIVGVIIPALSGNFSFGSIISFLMITILMSILLLFFHVPKVGEKLEKPGKSVKGGEKQKGLNKSKTSGKSSKQKSGQKPKSKQRRSKK